MISPSDMLLFATVVREGSFTRAANELSVTKQTVSERVAKLEEQLGVRLLERTTRRLRVTDAGAGYFERCNLIAQQIEEANHEVQQQQLEPSGLLRISAPVLYGRRYLAPVVAQYLAAYPKTRVEVVLADRRVQLVDEGFDLAVRIGALDDSSLAAKKLGEGHVYYVASPGYLAASKRITRANLSAMRCIGTKPGETWTLGGTDVKIDPVLIVNDLEMACEAAVAGVGVAQVPAIVCREAVARGSLVVLFSREAPMLKPVYVVFPSRRHLSVKVRFFVNALAELVEPMKPLS